MKVLLPVLPTERFYDAVVAAADLVADRGGTITFLFTNERAPDPQQTSSAEVTVELDSSPDVDADLGLWQQSMIDALDDARQLVYERGLGDEHLSYAFADFDTPPAQSIADEAAAGGYDIVVMSRGELTSLPDLPGQAPEDIASAIRTLRDEGVRLMVT